MDYNINVIKECSENIDKMRDLLVQIKIANISDSTEECIEKFNKHSLFNYSYEPNFDIINATYRFRCESDGTLFMSNSSNLGLLMYHPDSEEIIKIDNRSYWNKFQMLPNGNCIIFSSSSYNIDVLVYDMITKTVKPFPVSGRTMTQFCNINNEEIAFAYSGSRDYQGLYRYNFYTNEIILVGSIKEIWSSWTLYKLKSNDYCFYSNEGIWICANNDIYKLVDIDDWVNYEDFENGTALVSSSDTYGIKLYNIYDNTYVTLYETGLGWTPHIQLSNGDFLISAENYTNANEFGLLYYDITNNTIISIHDKGYNWRVTKYVTVDKILIYTTNSNSAGMLLFNTNTKTIIKEYDLDYMYSIYHGADIVDNIDPSIKYYYLMYSNSTRDSGLIVYNYNNDEITKAIPNGYFWNKYDWIKDTDKYFVYCGDVYQYGLWELDLSNNDPKAIKLIESDNECNYGFYHLKDKKYIIKSKTVKYDTPNNNIYLYDGDKSDNEKIKIITLIPMVDIVKPLSNGDCLLTYTGNHNKIFKFNLSNNTITELAHIYDKTTSSINLLENFYELSNGHCLFSANSSSYKELFRYNGSIIDVVDIDRINNYSYGWANNVMPITDTEYFITCANSSSAGIAGGGGLLIYDINTSKIENYILYGIYKFIALQNGDYLIGATTYNCPTIFYNSSNKTYSQVDGINYISSFNILSLKNGDFLFSVNNSGVWKYNSVSRIITKYDTPLVPSTITITYSHISDLAHGHKLLYGSNDGVYWYNNDTDSISILNNDVAFSSIVTIQLKNGDELYLANSKSIFRYISIENSVISLSSFTGLNRNNYFELDNENILIYSNISSGFLIRYELNTNNLYQVSPISGLWNNFYRMENNDILITSSGNSGILRYNQSNKENMALYIGALSQNYRWFKILDNGDYLFIGTSNNCGIAYFNNISNQFKVLSKRQYFNNEDDIQIYNNYVIGNTNTTNTCDTPLFNAYDYINDELVDLVGGLVKDNYIYGYHYLYGCYYAQNIDTREIQFFRSTLLGGNNLEITLQSIEEIHKYRCCFSTLNTIERRLI